MKESIKTQLDIRQPDVIQNDRNPGADLELNELRQWLNESADNRKVLQRLEAFDDAISVALHDVEVPVDLAAKIRQSVQNVGGAESPDARDAELLAAAIDEDGRLSPIHREEFAGMFDADENDQVRLAAPAKSEHKTRRTFIAVATVATLAAAVMLGVFFSGLFSGSRDLISSHQLCREAATWDPNSTGGDWIQDLSAAPTNYPASDRLNVSASQWKQFAANRYDSKSIVYDMTPPGDTQIFLFALRADEQFDVPATFSAAPIYSVDGFSIGTCQRDGVTYVLLVEGDKDRYRKVVKTVGEFV